MKKMKICLNVLLHYGKYRKLVGEQVKIIKNNGLKKYDKLLNKIGYVYDFEFCNFKKPIIVLFNENGVSKEYCFSLNEIKQIKIKKI